MSKTLATIKIDVPIQFDASRYTIDPMNREKLTELFKELEFRTLAMTILGGEGKEGVQQNLFGKTATTEEKPDDAEKYKIGNKTIENVKHKYSLIHDDAAHDSLVAELVKQTSFSFDTETTGIDPHQAELVGMSFSYVPHEAYYVPVPEDREAALDIVQKYKSVLEDPSIEKIGQNIKYDLLMMKWYGVELQGYYFDTMIAHYLSEPDKRHKLDYLSESYLDYKMVPITDLIGKKGKDQLSMRDVDLNKEEQEHQVGRRGHIFDG